MKYVEVDNHPWLDLSARGIEPRAWQVEALDKWRRQMKGVVSVVTGGGKTVFAELCISDFLVTHDRGQVVVIVPTIALLDQWFVSLQEDFRLPPEAIGVFGGKERSREAGRINLTVVNTARTIAPVLSSRAPTLLVVDECHRLGSPRNAEALAGIHAATLGLSATPERDYDDGFQQYIEPALGPVIYNYGYSAAMRDGVIADFERVNVRVELLPHEATEYSRLSRRIAQASESASARQADDETMRRLLIRRAAVSAGARMRIPVAAALVERHPGSRSIVFHERITEAETILEILMKRGHNATIYHSKMSSSLRRDNLRLFRRGQFDVLVTCRALDEGANVPEAEVAVIASSTASTRQRIQRLGRVLRPARGKQRAVIYTLYATDVEASRLLDEGRDLDNISPVAWKSGRVG